MGRPNPKNNPTMQRVEAPAPVIVKTPPPAPVIVKTPPPPKFTRKKITQPYLTSSSSTNVEQNRNVTQPVKKPTDWCGCEWWDVGCSAGCFAQEQIVDPIVSGTEWIGGGVEEHITQPIVSGTEYISGGFDVHVTQPIVSGTEYISQGFVEAYEETQNFFGGVATDTQENIENIQNELDKIAKELADTATDVVDTVTDVVDTVGGGVIYLQDTVGGGVKWMQQQSDNAGKMFNDIAQMPSGFGTMMGNMMRGMGNLANVGSGSMGWIKWVLIAIGALIAGFIAWRVLK